MKKILFCLLVLFSAVGSAYSNNNGSTKIIGGHQVQVTGENDQYIFIKRKLLGGSWNGIYDKQEQTFFFYQISYSDKPHFFNIETIAFPSKTNPSKMSVIMKSEFICSKGVSRLTVFDVSDQYYGEGNRSPWMKDGYSLINGAKQEFHPFDSSLESLVMKDFCAQQK